MRLGPLYECRCGASYIRLRLEDRCDKRNARNDCREIYILRKMTDIVDDCHKCLPLCAILAAQGKLREYGCGHRCVKTPPGSLGSLDLFVGKSKPRFRSCDGCNLGERKSEDRRESCIDRTLA